jgi:hypothetical protein
LWKAFLKLRDRRQCLFLKENLADAFTLMDLYKGWCGGA